MAVLEREDRRGAVSGATAVAAALAGRSPAFAAPVVAIISGGNIGLDKLEELRALRGPANARRIELFDMERMQSTWENIVDYDMSESGVRPLTLRELVAMGFDLDEFLDTPLGYSQSNGTMELREKIAALYPGATHRQRRGHQRHV